MMKYIHKLLRFSLIGLLLCLSCPAQALVDPACRSLQVDESEYAGPHEYSKGLLWKVSKPGMAPSYIFGTIHVADENIINIPEVIRAALSNSSVFVMEALPEPGEAMLFAGMMFFDDGNKLDKLVTRSIFNRTVEILSAYHMSEDVISVMKPWAAFLTMSYPAEMGAILDLQLLRIAQANELEVFGLETLREQGDIFNNMQLDDQVRLLTDAVCHYDVVANDFRKMKDLYMDRDLKGLYLYGQRYSFPDDIIYENLTRRLLTERNHTMVERMQSLLEEGNAFVAVGAMHLPGDEGVLALLSHMNYKILRIY